MNQYIDIDTLSLELVEVGLSFPTSIAFDENGVLYVAESGLPFGGNPPGGKVWQVKPGVDRKLIKKDLRAPVNGLTYHKGRFFISEGGYPSRISSLKLSGEFDVILDGFPGPGNYHTNMVAIGPDGKLYFSQGAMTNTGVIGLDAYELGWLKQLPHAHDVPGYDITLAGENFETINPFDKETNGRISTGAFSPFGKETKPGQKITGAVPCTSSIMRCDEDGKNLEVVAWGIRNAYGLGFLPDGRLLAVDQGADDRGSRPVGNVPDLLFEIKKGAWYGWPDYIGHESITNEKYKPHSGIPPTFILADHSLLPPPEVPLLCFPPHAAAVKFDVAPTGINEWGGHIFVALFGDEIPMTAPIGPRIGRSIVRINPADWSLWPFVKDSLNRPIDIKFHPRENRLYILDFGEFEMSNGLHVEAKAKTGKVWRLKLPVKN